jgi:WD40 repeat protein
MYRGDRPDHAGGPWVARSANPYLPRDLEAIFTTALARAPATGTRLPPKLLGALIALAIAASACGSDGTSTESTGENVVGTASTIVEPADQDEEQAEDTLVEVPTDEEQAEDTLVEVPADDEPTAATLYHTDWVRTVVELANGNIASAGDDVAVKIWDPANPEVTITRYAGHSSWVWSVVELAN